MAKKFSALVAATMSPESIRRSQLATQAMREEMPLNELRQARGLSQKALAARLNADRKLGYAIVGLGYYGLNVIIPQFKNCEHSRVWSPWSAATRPRPETVAAEYGVPERGIYNYQTYDSIRDNPDIDIVYVCLPVSMHAEYTIRAAKAGKHVMCEKPMATCRSPTARR
jgi:hypothetical protein